MLWAPILQAILLRRPHAKGRDYDAIWNKERNEGPLKTITRSQGEKLGVALHDLDKEVVVDWAMRYGAPPIAERLKALQAEGCDRILVIPLYPQYCAASTATVGDKAFEALQAMRWQPAIRVAAPYYDDPVYIDALARSVRGALAGLDSSRRSWSPLITAFRRPISTRATPISAIARRRRGSCATRSA